MQERQNFNDKTKMQLWAQYSKLTVIVPQPWVEFLAIKQPKLEQIVNRFIVRGMDGCSSGKMHRKPC